jgi:hypothetical protein
MIFSFYRLSPEQTDAQHHSIFGLKALMNNSYGLAAMIAFPTGISVLGLSLSCNSYKLKTIVLELLAAICFLPPNGHQLTTDALSHYQKVKREKFRFQSMMVDMKDSDVKTLGILEFKVCCVLKRAFCVDKCHSVKYR